MAPWWDWLRKLWRDYNLSLVLLACFILSWFFQAWTGWREFAAEQAQHNQAASVFGNDGYIWTLLQPRSKTGSQNFNSCWPWSS